MGRLGPAKVCAALPTGQRSISSFSVVLLSHERPFDRGHPCVPVEARTRVMRFILTVRTAKERFRE